mgnify:CR=1 FL=1
MASLPKISNVDEYNNTLKFTLSNINVSYANAIRRILLSDIPCIVFKTNPYHENNVNIKINKSRLNNELIKQRISSIPIHIDNIYDFPYQNYIVELDKTNNSNTIVYATTEDLKIKNIDSEKYLETSEVRQLFPPDTITGDYIDILRLRPKLTDTSEPEQLKFEAKLTISTAKEDGTFNVVSTCAYGNTLDPVKIQDAWSAKEASLKDTVSKEELEFLKKDWMLLDAKRLFIEDSFDFTIETIGIYSNYKLLELGISLIIKKLYVTLESLKNENELIYDATDTLDNCYIITLLNEDYTIGLSLIEHQDSHYTWATKTQAPTVPTTNLPNPFTVEKPSIDSVTDEVIELFDGSVVSKLVVNLSSTDDFVDEFEVEYKESTATDYRLMRRGSNSIIEKYPVKEGVIYDIRARAINSFGSKSAFTTTQHEVITAFDPPDTVQNYSIDVVGDKLHHTFDAVTNLDLDYYEIRFTSDTTETVYANTTVLVPRIARPATSVVTPFVGTGKFFIKAVDKFGVRSTTASSVVISEQVIDGIKPITTITEETAFTGTKTDCVVVDNALILDTSDNFDDGVGNVDDALGLFDAGNNSVVSSGTYDFDGFDFGAKFKIKLLLNQLNVDHLDYVDSFDAQSGLFDLKEGFFDGDTDEAISSNVQLQIALSDDNVTFGSYQNFKAGDYVARAVKFRAILTSTDTSATPKINNLSIKLLLPTVIQDGSNVSSGTDLAGKTVTFDNPYYQTPTITIIAQDLNTGDYFTLNSKSASNFNIEFFDSGGNTVDRTFDFQAVGLGSQQ